MHIRKRYLLLAVVVIVAIIYLFTRKGCTDTQETTQFNVTLQQLRGVNKLVVWEQDFTLSDLQTKEKTYLKWFTTKESVVTTVNGRMGFHIDISDSVHTHITRTAESVLIQAPLQITYVSLDMASLQQLKDASINPAVAIDEKDIVKHLDQKALEKYLPAVKAAISTKALTAQEQQLQKLTGLPVHIEITSMPTPSQYNELNKTIP